MANRAFVCFATCCLLLSACSAYPSLWAGQADCLEHPLEAKGDHMSPGIDR